MKKVPPGEAAHFFSARMTPEKQAPVPGNDYAQAKVHGPGNWAPVFRLDHAQTNLFDGRS
jgi:hypothetical protein